MLTLRRNEGQGIIVIPPRDAEITVTVVEVDHGWVTLETRRGESVTIHKKRVLGVVPLTDADFCSVADVDNKKHRTWLNFDTDAETEIYREEIWKHIREERRDAS